METLKGKVSNIRRDVNVIEASYSDSGSGSGSTTDITNFELGGRSMQYKSGRATYNSISEGDELIVAGKSKRTVFQVIAFRNVTKNLNSYTSKSIPLLTVMATGILVFGIGVSALFFFTSRSLALPPVVFIMFVGISSLLFYWDYRHRDAVKSIENHR